MQFIERKGELVTKRPSDGEIESKSAFFGSGKIAVIIFYLHKREINK